MGSTGFAVYGGWTVRAALDTGVYVGRHNHLFHRDDSPIAFWAHVGLMAVGSVMFIAAAIALAILAVSDRSIRRIDKRFVTSDANQPIQASLDPTEFHEEP